MNKKTLAFIALTLAGCTSLPSLLEAPQTQIKARAAIGGNRITPLVCAEEVYPAIERLIESASQSIQMETYLFGGEVGRRIGDRLLAKHRAGVKVQLVLDPSLGGIGSARKQMTEAVKYYESQGLEVTRFAVNKLPSGHTWMARRRRIEHSKLVVADGQRAVVGGMNAYDDAAKARDYMMLVDGPAATKFGEMVQEDYLASGGKGSVRLNGRPAGQESVQIGDNGISSRTIKPVLLDAINSAKERVWIEMLLMDNDDVINALIAAHQRGVDVRVVLDKSAVKEVLGSLGKKLPLEGITNLATVERLFDAKVPVRWYEPMDRAGIYTYLHAKLMIADGSVLTGSSNYTFQALDLNREVVARTSEDEAVERFASAFQSDWKTHTEDIQSLSKLQRAIAAIYDKVRRMTYRIEEREDGDPVISTEVLSVPSFELGI